MTACWVHRACCDKSTECGRELYCTVPNTDEHELEELRGEQAWSFINQRSFPFHIRLKCSYWCDKTSRKCQRGTNKQIYYYELFKTFRSKKLLHYKNYRMISSILETNRIFDLMTMLNEN